MFLPVYKLLVAKKKGGGGSKPPPHGSVYDTGPCESLVLISFRLKIKY